uniref:PTS sugar transporter subunit IIB n=1 Tax=Ndongobacter massiliensis TaxID=1871025 RepID=UPI000930299D|nr:PTS sugar transporter subunit IIB [Ndongobacter massiliensis]
MAVKKIMCCCGSGIGSSLMVRLNVEKVLKKMGKDGIEVVHSTTSDAQPGAADIFVVGKDLEDFVATLPNKVVLHNIMSLDELEEKLSAEFEKLGA